MAKKKKKRPAPRPTAPVEQGPARQEKKEAARKEREARVRAARRRVMLRRLSRIGILVLIVGLIAGFIWWQGQEGRRITAAAEAVAERLDCTEIQDMKDEGGGHLAAGETATYGEKPANSGKHSPSTLEQGTKVLDQPVDATVEPLAVHNLEHGYTIIYYRQGTVPEPVVDRLADFARDETKVIVAPYAELPEGKDLVLVGWTKEQSCPEIAEPSDAIALARAFIRVGGERAPEPGAP